jgi:hypothetical protein
VGPGVQAGDAPGSEFQITKAKRGRATAQWIVEQIAEEPPYAQQLAHTATAPQSRPAPTPAPRTVRYVDGPATDPRQQQTPGELDTSTMYGALCAAIRTAASAERYAAEIGRPLAFETGDIRAMAASIYIRTNGGH